MAIVVTVSDIRTRWPDPFSDTDEYSDAFIQFNIDDALNDMAIYTQLPETRATIMAQLLVAHYCVCDENVKLGDTGDLSPVNSISLGDGSTSFQSSEARSAWEAFLLGTVFGQRFLWKLKTWVSPKRPYMVI